MEQVPSNSDNTDREALRDVIDAAAAVLTKPSRRTAAMAYLRQRGIDTEGVSSQWVIGYAPPGWTRLVDELTGRFPDQSLIAAGLARRSSRGSLIDTFRDRVLFGIRDRDGDVAGFIGRDVSGDANAPKYLNSSQSPIFDKSRLLYGLSEGLQEPGRLQLVIVEGPLDVLAIAARAAGEQDTLLPVASCGTAFTVSHAQLVADLPRASQRAVVVAMDGDAPGRVASLVAGERLRRTGLDVRLASLPSGSDPAEYLARPNSNLDVFRADNGIPLVVGRLQFEIARRGDGMQWIEGRLAAMRGMAKYLASYPPPYVARQVVWLAGALDIAPATVTRELAQAMVAPRGGQRRPEQSSVGATRNVRL